MCPSFLPRPETQTDEDGNTTEATEEETTAAWEDGQALVKEYYNIAPTIVNRINRQDNAEEIYGGIWDSWLSGCVHLIEAGEKEACREKYMDMVYELKERYMA